MKYVVRFIGGSYLLCECLTTLNETTARRFDTVADADAAIRIAVELRRTERHWHWHGREVRDWRVEPAGVFTDSRSEIAHLRGVLARADTRRPEYLRGLGVTRPSWRNQAHKIRAIIELVEAGSDTPEQIEAVQKEPDLSPPTREYWLVRRPWEHYYSLVDTWDVGFDSARKFMTAGDAHGVAVTVDDAVVVHVQEVEDRHQ